MLTEISRPGTETAPHTALSVARVQDVVSDSTVTVALVRPIICLVLFFH